MKTLIPAYKDKLLRTRKGEVWKDIFGFEGNYSISSDGRIRSNKRIDPLGRQVRERMLSQHLEKSQGVLNVRLSLRGFITTHSVSQEVGKAFCLSKEVVQGKNPDSFIVFAHLNKIKTDNRAVNLKTITRSKSAKIEVKLGIRKPLPGAKIMKERAIENLNETGVFEDGKLIGKTCKVCNETKPITEYVLQYTSDQFYYNDCKKCRAVSSGTKNIGKLKASIELAEKGKRKCLDCKEVKALTDYPANKGKFKGRDYTCKNCMKIRRKKYMDNQRDTIGDTYVRLYVKRKYNFKVLDSEIPKYRKEIIKNRKKRNKPKYHLDNKDFTTLTAFSDYVLAKYGLPKTMTESRIRRGYSEKDCKLSEKQARSISMKKQRSSGRIKVVDQVTNKVMIFESTTDPELLKKFNSSTLSKYLKSGEPTMTSNASKYKNPVIITKF